MSISTVKSMQVLVKDARVDAHMLHVSLQDGRQIGVPLEWFPRLRKASEKQRKHWRLIGHGIGIHWPDVDEDISVASLLES